MGLRSGFYWVKLSDNSGLDNSLIGVWIIAELLMGSWFVTGLNIELSYSNLSEIDHNRLRKD